VDYQAFSDELEKIAISRGRMNIPQSRKGKRPMRVSTLLKKEKEGTLYKEAAFSAFADELEKIATGSGNYQEPAKPPASKELEAKILEKYPHLLKKKASATPPTTLLGRLATDAATHKAEVAGLGMLAAMPLDTLQAKIRARRAGGSGHDWEKKSLLGGETGHAIADVAGLGVLAAPSIAHLRGHG
jgi:hypothetical protein